jgi:hypothetical protein
LGAARRSDESSSAVRAMSDMERPLLARSGQSLKHPRQLSAGSSKDLDAVLVETQHGWHQWRQV